MSFSLSKSRNNRNMLIIYRISDAGYNKVKPPYINNENCLRNALKVFPEHLYKWLIIADNISEPTREMIKSMYKGEILEVSVGHGAGTFNIALDKALESEEKYFYFLENDYLHKPNAGNILYQGFELGADFISLYDHPDKYIDGANPEVEGGGETTRVFLTKDCHWKLTNSTTMTFATSKSTLIKYNNIIRQFTQGSYPRDFDMFIALRSMGCSLITPIPGYSTHGETAWLSPLTNWETI